MTTIFERSMQRRRRYHRDYLMQLARDLDGIAAELLGKLPVEIALTPKWESIMNELRDEARRVREFADQDFPEKRRRLGFRNPERRKDN